MGQVGMRRVVAAVGAGITAVVYVLIGTRVVFIAATEDTDSGAIPPMLLAAAGFAVLAVLLAVSGRRWVLAYGIVLEVLVIVGYVALASARTPSFEAWGLSLKAGQFVLLALLIHLALRGPAGR